MTDLSKLRWWFKPIDSIFKHFRKYALDFDNPKKRRIFIDRGSKVLLVAHLDTVLAPKFIKQKKNRIWATGLDDRLGCCIAYELSEKLNTDLLLTDLEESGESTGYHHQLKDYNWIAEFDRAGNDVVHYGLVNDKFLEALSDHWKIGFGSYSDISSLQTEACCLNLGIGYAHAHSKNSYFDISICRKQILLFQQFYAKHKDTKFVQDTRYRGFGRLTAYDPYDFYDLDGITGECDFCGCIGKQVYGWIICESCLESMVERCYDLTSFGEREC